MCSKHYAKAHKFSPGALTFCCGCKHPLILALSVLDRKEAPQVLLNMLFTRFARLPRLLIYDFPCGVSRVALGKLGWLLMDCTIVSNRFHIFNYLCSDAFDPRSYSAMDGVDSGAPEQRNAPIRRIQTTLQGMGAVPYANLLAYLTGLLNHEANTKWDLGVERLSEDVDLSGENSSTYSCLCCDGAESESEGSCESSDEFEKDGQSDDETGSCGSSQGSLTGAGARSDHAEGEAEGGALDKDDGDSGAHADGGGNDHSASAVSEDVSASASQHDSSSGDEAGSGGDGDSFDE